MGEYYVGFYNNPHTTLKPCVKINANDYTDAKNQFVKYLEKSGIENIDGNALYIICFNHLITI